MLAQEWAGTTMQDLMKAVVRLSTTNPKIAKQDECNAQIESILSLCDRLAVAAEVATASIHVAANERLELNSEMSETEADIAREEAEVDRLRKLLERERKQVERRAQYDALAKVILEEPAPEVSQKRLDEATKESDQVGKEVAKLQEVKEAMSKELTLFLHSASNLESFSATFEELLKGEHENAMDTSS